MSDPFNSIRSLVPKRSRRTLVDERTFDYDIGQAIPVEFRDCVPGDNLKIYFNVINRFKALVAPTMGRLTFSVYYFFVPYRTLDPNFERGITGGDDEDLDDDGNPVAFEYKFPTLGDYTNESAEVKKFSLLNYIGLPIGLKAKSPLGAEVTDYMVRAYNAIYNEWFRDETLQRKRKLQLTDRDFDSSLTESVDTGEENYGIFNVSWKKDYFTSALLSQQKGVAPALPLSGELPVYTYYVDNGNSYSSVSNANSFNRHDYTDNATKFSNKTIYFMDEASNGSQAANFLSPKQFAPNYVYGKEAIDSAFYVKLHDGTTFDVAELRTVVQIQKILERANRTGSRYTEYLRSFFSVSPKDSRLQRPEFIGAGKVPVIINEVLQTSETTQNSAQGTQTGHGINIASNYIGKYFCEEYGCLVGIAFCRPVATYSQGVNRQFFKKSRYDFYLPQLCNLSEQGILAGEIYADNTEKDTEIWGFQGRWNEMRSGTSFVMGSMVDTYSYWHFGRHFDSRPELDSDFIQCKPAETKKIYAVQSEPGIMCQFATIIDAVRPITAYPEPGRLDHDM